MNNNKSDWQRGKDALEKILTWTEIELLEALAEKIQSKKFRNSIGFNLFINQLKKEKNAQKVKTN